MGERIVQARLQLAARRNRPVPQTEIAKAVGVTGAAIGRYEAGKQQPSYALLERIAAALDVSPGYLAFGELAERPIITTPREKVDEHIYHPALTHAEREAQARGKGARRRRHA